eukprot:scaffold22345_cov125-Isochrysis_galbana.AAC.5
MIDRSRAGGNGKGRREGGKREATLVCQGIVETLPPPIPNTASPGGRREREGREVGRGIWVGYGGSEREEGRRRSPVEVPDGPTDGQYR